MGQNARAIQEVVVNLQNNKLITPDQAQSFMKDYQNNSPKIEEVNKFIHDPNLTYFLKYYIGCKYKSKIKQQNCSTNVWGSSRSEIEEQILEIAQIQMKNKVIELLKSGQRGIVKSVKQCCQLVIHQNYNLFKCKIKKLFKQAMGFQEFHLLAKNKQNILSYQSQIEFFSQIYPTSLNWRTYMKEFSLKHEFPFHYNQSKDHYIFHFFYQSSEYLIKIKINQKVKGQIYQTLLKKEQKRNKIIKVIVKLLQYFRYQCPYLQALTIFSIHAFQIIQIGAQILQQQIKSLINSFIPLQDQVKESDVKLIDFIKRILTRNTHNNINRKQIMVSIEKRYEKFQKQFKLLEQYCQIIKRQQFFLDFDKYSQLRFCFMHRKKAYQQKLKKCSIENRMKVIDVMCQHPDLLNKLGEVGKNKQKQGIIKQASQSFAFSIFVDQNCMLQRVLIILDKKDQKPMKISHLSFDTKDEKIGKEKEKENNKSTSRMQEKIVKDLERQDPNIRKTGWLKLFVKQHSSLQPSVSSRQQIQLSVTDFEKIDSIDHNLNVLDLSEKQLILWVWTIMKTNPLFCLLVKDLQTETKFNNFLNELNYQYSINNNKFHNFYHAINVLHMCSILINSQKIQNSLTNIQLFSILISGLCHDVGHSGFSNQYQILTFSQKAITYNDISPLQNFQASKTIQIFKNNQNNFIQKMDKDKYIQFKQNLIHNILSTDMSQHFIVFDKFKEWTKLPKDQAKCQSSALTAMIVHTSDFAGSCKQFKIAQQWSHRLNLQFQNQQQNYRKIGIKNIQQGSKMSGKVFFRNQISYLQVIILPLYEEICNFQRSNGVILEIVQLLKKNKSEWEKLNKE